MILLHRRPARAQGEPRRPAQGTVLEARKEIGRGIVATVLVQNGTLRRRRRLRHRRHLGPRALDERRPRPARRTSPGPSTPVEVTGFSDVPEAGDMFQVVEDEQKARTIVEFRQQEQRKRELAAARLGKLSLEQLFSQIQQGEVKELARGAQGRRAGLGRGAARHARASSSTDEGQGQRAPRRGRRDLDQRRPARLRLQGDHRRLQRPARTQRRRAGREGAGRDPAPHRHLRARSTSCARR